MRGLGADGRLAGLASTVLVLALLGVGGGLARSGRTAVSEGPWDVTVGPDRVRPGEFVAVVVTGAGVDGEPEGWSGELAGQRFGFYPAGQGRVAALVAVSYHQEPGAYPLAVRAPSGREVRLTLPVEPRDFEVQRLTVPPSQEALVRPRDPEAIERQRREAEEVAAARARSSPQPLWDGPFVWPLDGARRITSEFGLMREVNGRVTERHSGLDLAAPAGTPVRAANAGRVVLAREHMVTGKTVILDHGWGLFTSYLHLSSMAVQEGQMVRKGQVIGQVGSTGFSTGPHLHWAAWVPRAFVDPRLLLEGGRWPPELLSVAR
ncbi:M23 family metallopeptidase [Geochorda subterranea]|uniref:M23 family metallopeptidase n=1 Tax=Geochorda subterranea TaxID=3109564 RepID=A0ABZ1BM72_9FIRM|nr:M23 family metallopeptidase [Limnochorda sp. LNt]WRP13625.1 M23 family metallopeptidase [Limnochorda sp. LNt]